jgi:hypothetical protein
MAIESLFVRPPFLLLKKINFDDISIDPDVLKTYISIHISSNDKTVAFVGKRATNSVPPNADLLKERFTKQKR